MKKSLMRLKIKNIIANKKKILIIINSAKYACCTKIEEAIKINNRILINKLKNIL